ncbi:diguanylate cyclase domain-containing protein [Nitrincola alkalilacustris]|uniref:diguanylate cyclase domain-containing protein n=1 Tax=Nitrincola alkalilacustris TaxID=1571224 RepID=UPI001456E495|nr:diguanylate cyclase [Nitrincola alkalilacustris]
MLIRYFEQESHFDSLLLPIRCRADRIMVLVSLFLFLVCLSLSPVYNSWGSALLIGLPTLLLVVWMGLRRSGQLWTRLVMAGAFMVYTGLIIHQMRGDIASHFSAFGLIAVLLYYRDWRTIISAVLVIFLHHAVLGFLEGFGVPVYVFGDQQEHWFHHLLVHFAYFLPFIGMMIYLSIWLRREGFESQNVIELANRIARGSLAEELPRGELFERSELIRAVTTMKTRLLDLLRVMPVPVAVIRLDDHTVVSTNSAWEERYGLGNIVGNRFGQCPIWAEPETWSYLLERLNDAQSKLLDKVEVRLRRVDGVELICELSMIIHENIEPVMAILTLEDVTERRRAEQYMHQLAYNDMLTSLANRARLHKEMERSLQLCRARQIPFAVILLDLDDFKPINDQYGHDAGDEVLKLVAARLMAQIRDQDLVARLGGDEFVVLLNSCHEAQRLTAIAERILVALQEPLPMKGLQGESLHIGASIGVVWVQDGENDVDQLLKMADNALYEAKRQGKNSFVLHQHA